MTLPRVVGLDPSLTASGIAWPDGRCIRRGRAGLTKADRPLVERGAALMGLVLEVGNLVLAGPDLADVEPPALVLIEEIPREHLDSERAYLWWSVVNLLGRRGVDVVEVQPSTIKKYALGKGSGKGVTKAAVVDAAARRMPQFVTGGDDNLADAAWLCALGCDLLGHPIVELPAAHRDTIHKIKIPERLAPNG